MRVALASISDTEYLVGCVCWVLRRFKAKIMAESAESVPMISISGDAEGENFSLSDSEEANKAKTLIASRMRRRQKKKGSTSTAGGLKRSSLIIDDGDESAVTDCETVEVDNDEPDSPASSPVEDLSPVIDAALKPQIIQIIDDHQGQVHIRSIVKNVVASLQDGSDASEMSDTEDSPSTARPNAFLSAATDIESLENSSAEEHDGFRSDTSEMNHIIDQLDLGGQVDMHDKEELAKPQHQRASSAAGTGGLLCPKSAAGGRKKMRKSRKKKSSSSNAGQPGATSLTVSTPDNEDPVTDIESVSGISGGDEDDASEKQEAGAVGGYKPLSLTVGVEDDEGTTDIEDLNFSDDDGASGAYSATPGIVVTVEASDTESHDCSGRSSRLGLTDVESIDDNEVPAAASALGVPGGSDDPLTDVEDIDGVEGDEAMTAHRPPPPNGPSRNSVHRQVVTIQEDENGVVTSRKTARSPNLLSLAVQSDEAGVSDVENISVSGDEDHHDDDQHNEAPAAVLEQLEVSSSVRVQRHSFSEQAVDAEQESNSMFSLMPPVQTAEILTDTEDMEMSDSESSMQPGRFFLPPSVLR